MSDLVAISFPDVATADKALEGVRQLDKEGLLKLEDAAVVTRDAEGKVSYHSTQPIPGAGAGALFGGLWGLLFGAIFFVPVLGLAAGAAAGAIAGALGKDDIDHAFKQQINDELRPNASMLFIRTRDVKNAEQILERLRAEGLGGKVIRTNLSQDAEKALQDALDSRPS